MWLIVGLGNPGPRYELTRHNIGFLGADFLLDELGQSTKSGFSGHYARCNFAEQPIIVLKPETFMNRSGQAVQQAVAFHKIDLAKIIVIHDELDLPLGELRIKRGGSDGGHNGLKDITRYLGPEYIRVRLGIGRPAIKGIEADFVLSPFSNVELKEVGDILPKAALAIRAVIENGLDFAQAHCQIKQKKS
ncbi:MAG TPA: aminoacyl-tRNA hydrolase [Myxococcota bacterium]|nr:aminoacyl-tRNA hydrolase [Myxococcota bacterium]